LKNETRCAVDDKAFFQGECIYLTDSIVIHCTTGILDPARYIHTDYRSGFTQASGLNDQIFKSHIIRIRIGIRFSYFAVNHDITSIFQVMDARNIKNVVFHQDDVWGSTIHNGFNIYRDNFSSQVFTLTVENGTIQESITGQALSFVYQFTDCIQFSIQLVDAGTINGSTDFKLVDEAVKDGFGGYNITVSHFIDTIVKVFDCVYFIFLPILAYDTQRTGVGIGFKPTGIADKSG